MCDNILIDVISYVISVFFVFFVVLFKEGFYVKLVVIINNNILYSIKI